jgi:hypothetical protein
MNTPMSFVFRFPQELIDKIIRENDTDLPTLRSCALVCRAFLSSSQAGIFFEIKLSKNGGAHAQKIYDSL